MTEEEVFSMAVKCYLISPGNREGFYGDALIQFAKLVAEKAIKEALAQPEQEPVVHDPLPRACNLAGVDYQTFLKIKAYMPVAPPQPEQIQPSAYSNTHQPERHELQAKGEHPAPCARHCEANAFQIVIKNLKAQLAQPKQEPVACVGTNGELMWLNKPRVIYSKPQPLYTTQPRRTWVGLTDEDMADITSLPIGTCSMMLKVEAKLKEKNT